MNVKLKKFYQNTKTVQNCQLGRKFQSQLQLKTVLYLIVATLPTVAVALLLTAALAALLTLLCLLIPNRAVSAVAAILLMFGLIVVGSVFYNALCEPEMAAAAIMTVNGFEVGEPTPNPDYVSGALRTVYQFAVDALPTGQAILLANQELAHPAVSLSASAGLVLLCTAVGMLVFRRKDLK